MNYMFKYQAGINLYITPPDLNYVLIMHAWRPKQHESFELISLLHLKPTMTYMFKYQAGINLYTFFYNIYTVNVTCGTMEDGTSNSTLVSKPTNSDSLFSYLFLASKQRLSYTNLVMGPTLRLLTRDGTTKGLRGAMAPPSL